MDCVGGDADKFVVGKESGGSNMQVMTTTDVPPAEAVPFHTEPAQTSDAPDYVCLFCHINDECEGGSTSLKRES